MSELVKALAKARLDLENPERNKTASIPTKSGPGYSYKYSSLDEILDAVTPALSNNGLAITTTVEPTDGILFAVVALRHESGEVISSLYPMPEGLPAKDFGGILKTVRRHYICALLNISPVESDEDAKSQDRPTVMRKQSNPEPINQKDKLMASTKSLMLDALHLKPEECREWITNLFPGKLTRDQLSLEELKTLDEALQGAVNARMEAAS